MAGALTALTLATLLCGAPAAAAAAAAGTPDELSTELAVLASEGDAAALWRRATASAADAVVEALRKQDPSLSVELKGADLEVRGGGREGGRGRGGNNGGASSQRLAVAASMPELARSHTAAGHLARRWRRAPQPRLCQLSVEAVTPPLKGSFC